MKNILLLGATGSIGDSVLSVIEQNQQSLNLYAITLDSNTSKAKDISESFTPEYIHINNEKTFNKIKEDNEINSKVLNGSSDLSALINDDNVDIIVSAITGFAGLEATAIASKTGKTILLANKESIVAAGELILLSAESSGTTIIPIDSEHNAIFQCLAGEKNTDDVSKIIITASGGPFLNKSLSSLKDVTKEQALKHPNWSMGSKISIDSATLVNKCLELIEAKYLFGLDEQFFELVVHPQSIVHSIVSYRDGSSICQMSNPDMTVPIAHALSDSRRLKNNFDAIDFSSLSLTFNEFPEDRKKLENIAREVCKNGNSSGIIFNAANEIAVKNFLEDKISFNQIYDVIYRTFEATPMSNITDIESIYEKDIESRMEAKKVVKSIS
ncbi:1-deoxy-D-xylulose-5-phosphate reductoisomerase [Gammaproteobacteria bacterium]|nr:1-deoxy-D-xylulose-5-phosphate reductoisomerase [Gammaproteobacteria bacterium]MDC1377166.1 1-deoxy-D-xylulose-5-phosphate reductoisomerase [Gammaproteobacteria bacterium]